MQQTSTAKSRQITQNAKMYGFREFSIYVICVQSYFIVALLMMWSVAVLGFTFRGQWCGHNCHSEPPLTSGKLCFIINFIGGHKGGAEFLLGRPFPLPPLNRPWMWWWWWWWTSVLSHSGWNFGLYLFRQLLFIFQWVQWRYTVHLLILFNYTTICQLLPTRSEYRTFSTVIFL